MSDAPQPPAAASPAKHDPGTSGFWWIPGGMLAAAAAAILAWWFWPPNEAVRELSQGSAARADQEGPRLPMFSLLVDGDEALGAHRYLRDATFEWNLAPRSVVIGGEPDLAKPSEIEVRGFAFVDGGSAGLPLGNLLELTKIYESRDVWIEGTVEQLELEPGRYTIVLVVGLAGRLPSQASEVREPDAGTRWQLHELELEIAG
jgi:hypothetical protein